MVNTNLVNNELHARQAARYLKAKPKTFSLSSPLQAAGYSRDENKQNEPPKQRTARGKSFLCRAYGSTTSAKTPTKFTVVSARRSAFVSVNTVDPMFAGNSIHLSAL